MLRHAANLLWTSSKAPLAGDEHVCDRAHLSMLIPADYAVLVFQTGLATGPSMAPNHTVAGTKPSATCAMDNPAALTTLINT
jgi:hypothetical protein